MAIRPWRLATLMLIAWSMSVAMCHLLETPPKLPSTAVAAAFMVMARAAFWICARALLQTAALAALVYSVLVETPYNADPERTTQRS